MHFTKYHGLGNDYLVMQPEDVPDGLTPERIARICHRNYGVGSDGILLGPAESAHAQFAVRIFNPDGSEAEKSGNGLRIFARFLWDTHRVGDAPFTVETSGGVVHCRVRDGGRQVTVEMGTVSFDSRAIPVAGPAREVLNETIPIDGETLTYCAATIGNPHCIVLRDAVNAADARRYGPRLETDARFPNRTNVQFLQVLDRHAIRIEIWERGAGYTLASGSSSSAAAAVALKLGRVESPIAVHMPGGVLDIAIDAAFAVSMTGPVTHVCGGTLDPELFTA
jgi:diaminopimelate epimerase